jgi:tripartite-type tricarboxylate transporter receptor subunit TctC
MFLLVIHIMSAKKPSFWSWNLPTQVFAVLVLSSCLTVSAQSNPDTIELIVPTVAQGSTDLLARIVAKGLTQNGFGQINVRNMPGRSGTLAAAYVAAAKPDGRTLLVATPSSHGIASALDQKLPYDPINSFTSIVRFASAPYLLVVSPERIPDLASFRKEAMETPNKWAYSSTGVGGPHHLVAEFYFEKAGITLNHRPAAGGAAALQMLQKEEVQVMLPAAILAIPRIKQGQIKALAVTGSQRLAVLPDVPTFNESGVQMSMVSWYGLMAPKGLPKEQTEKLAKGVLSILLEPLNQKSLNDLGINITNELGADFDTTIKNEMSYWKSLVTQLGLQVDISKLD